MEMILGVDIGSVSLSLALLSPDGKLHWSAYRFHHGSIRECLVEELASPSLIGVREIACTSSTPKVLRGVSRFDTNICFTEAAAHLMGRLGCLLIVGGEKFCLLHFDENGQFQGSKFSSSCAAGTGSFLDQQAGRLGLSDSSELADLARRNEGEAPRIASRCSVFAKTDLSHAQQAGFSLEEICDGLCRGLARNIADTISGGDELRSPVVFAGGVSRNSSVVSHLGDLLACRLQVDEFSHLYGAIGAGVCCRKDRRKSVQIKISSEVNFQSPFLLR